MRKLYVLRNHENDGAVLDALEARGLDPDDVANPECPVCGSDTFLAYLAGDDFTVITWDTLNPEDEDEAEAWYLVCSEPACDYEEQVERTMTPAGAELFDLEQSESSMDECLGFTPAGLKEWIEYLQQLQIESPNRKLDSLLDSAQWRYDTAMEQIRHWLTKLPTGRRVKFTVAGQEIKATFLAATGEGLLALTQPDEELLAVPAESIGSYGPHYFDPNKADPPETDFSKIDPDRVIMIHGHAEYVVVRGHHLPLHWHEERFSLYTVGCRDEAVARELELRQTSEHSWEGRFRRHEIDARYDVKRMLKVRGHWVVKWGESRGRGRPAVHTEDPEVAAALGLRPVRACRRDDRPEEELPIVHWSGLVASDEVEDQQDVRLYHWPIPDAGTPEPKGGGA